MKRITSVLLIAVLLLATTISCNNDNKGSNGKKEGFYSGKIKAGHLISLDQAPLFIAKEKNFFKDEGLDVETVFFSNPGDNNTALAGGSIQFSTNPFTLPYFGVNSGVPMKIISSAGGLGIMEVIIQGEFSIENIQQLITYIKAHPTKKIKIAVLKGDTLEMIIQKMLADNGLTYDDVEMVWFNDLLAMVQSFQTKQVDILSHIKPYTTDMIVNHGAKSLCNNSDIWGIGTPNCTVAVLDDFASKYPGTVKSYLKALNKGFHFIVEHPEEAADILIKGNYFKVDKSVLLYAFKNQPKDVILKPNKEGVMMAINAMVKMNYIKEPKKDIIDMTYLDELNLK